MEGSSPTSENTTKQQAVESSEQPAEENVEILQLQIVLKESKPPIWRRIQIPSSYSFEKLHLATNQAMGWMDHHMHDFSYNDKIKGKKLRIISKKSEDDHLRVDSMFMSFRKPSNCSDVIETEILVVDLLKNEKDFVRYMYDFGDGWLHKITLEKKLLVKKSDLKNFPKCLVGKRACPPEDCGGIDRYNTLVTFLESKDRASHPDYKAYKEHLEYMDPNFDPAAFDADKIFKNGLRPHRVPDPPMTCSPS